MLTKEQKAFIRKSIESKIDITKEDIELLKDATKPISPENAIGRISRMDAINNKSVAEASLRTSLDKLKRLETALISLENKDFGICQKCKNAINYKRLAFMPESIRCMKCAR